MASIAQTKTTPKVYSSVGAILWILCLQYFIIQIIVANSWTRSYSIANNTISDLGNISCGTYSGRFVCSPDHGLMNFSFVLLGVLMIVGSIFVYQGFKKSLLTRIGLSCMVIAGIGTLLVGVFPENTIGALHVIGATMPFLIGNIGLVILGLALSIPKPLKIYTIISGVISLAALVFFVSHMYLGIGSGGMERITAYPQTIWFIVLGIFILKKNLSDQVAKN
jgi:hypothetical membrane protein